jgi:streptogramin lyase
MHRNDSTASRTAALLSVIIAAGCANGFGGAVAPQTITNSGGGASPHIVQSGSGGRVVIQLPSGSGPIDITAGPTYTMWITENTAGRIARLSLTSNHVTEYSLSNSGAQPYGIALGPDGKLYFAEVAGNAIGSITTSGAITEYPLPSAGSKPLIVAPGNDGNMWFSESGASRIGRITTAGAITEYSTIGMPWGVAAGPDGNEWFTDNTSTQSYVGNVTPTGVVTEYEAGQCGGCLRGIASATNGTLYFMLDGQNAIGQVSPQSGSVTMIAAPNTHDWLVERPGNAGHIFVYTSACCTNPLPVYRFDDKTGTTTLRERLPYQSSVDFLADGVDGNVYYAVHDVDAIVESPGHILLVMPNRVSLTGIGSTQTLTVSETDFFNRNWTAKTSNPSVATVAPGMDKYHFVVTAQGAGSCTITIADSTGNYVLVPTTVSL